jgi:hypothetical protein
MNVFASRSWPEKTRSVVGNALLIGAIFAANPAKMVCGQQLTTPPAGMMLIEPYPSLPKSGIVQFTLANGTVLLDYRDGRIAMVVPDADETTSPGDWPITGVSGVYCFYAPGEGAYRQPYDSGGSAGRETRLDPAAMQDLARQIKRETDGVNPVVPRQGALGPVPTALENAITRAAEGGCRIAGSVRQ